MAIQISGGVSFTGAVQIRSYLPPTQAPTNITVTQNNTSSVNISYTVAPAPVCTPITAVTAYSIPPGIVASVSTAGSGTINVGGLITGTNYSWYLTACNRGGASPYSTVSNIILLNYSGGVTSSSTQYQTPSAPSIILTNSTNTVLVNYSTGTSTGGTPIVSYTAKLISKNYGPIYTQSKNTSGTGTFVFSNICAYQNYGVDVYSTNLAGFSTLTSITYSPAYPPCAPIISTATVCGSVVTVNYFPPAYNGNGTISRYTAVSTPGNFVGYVCTPSAGGITVSISTSVNTNYTFQVYATNYAGNSALSSASNSVLALAGYVVNYLIVAGGGSGGLGGGQSGGGGGGGAGGLILSNSRVLPAASFPIVIGGGGSGVIGGYPSIGRVGTPSSAFCKTASGGGYGGGNNGGVAGPGGAGGSGGGGGGGNGGAGAGTSGQGYPGASGAGDPGAGGGGGGGGAGAGMVGGIGSATTIISTTLASSMAVGQVANCKVYFSGGGGGIVPSGGGQGGGGGLGGGTGALYGYGVAAAIPNTGGGGGGQQGGITCSSPGGSGVVIVSVPTSAWKGSYSGSSVSTGTVGSNTLIVFKASGTFVA